MIRTLQIFLVFSTVFLITIEHVFSSYVLICYNYTIFIICYFFKYLIFLIFWLQCVTSISSVCNFLVCSIFQQRLLVSILLHWTLILFLELPNSSVLWCDDRNIPSVYFWSFLKSIISIVNGFNCQQVTQIEVDNHM